MMSQYPIIYVRGYAMSESERDDTAADPFCGFNIGSTLYRAVDNTSKKAARFFFESPLIRLVTEYKYQHVYHDGLDIMDPNWEGGKDADGAPISGIPQNSIIIYRYYDDGSSMFGDGESRNISVYAEGLNKLIVRVRDLVCKFEPREGSPIKAEDFRCYLVAHSMGGLVVRALLQNDTPEYESARRSVDKLFTFATPHNGIDMLGKNVPHWLTEGQMNTFSRKIMVKYLHLEEVSPNYNERADLIPEAALSADRIFCMVGTNRGDYEPFQGAVRAFVGHGSDGLVRIDNASLWGIVKEGRPRQAATAYAYRSHSGYLGIVNSEEGYQNLVRFLFGDVRVDIWLDIAQVTLPSDLQKETRPISALYQFGLVAAPKGKRWYLTRRTSIEDSAACRSHAQLTNGKESDRAIYLSTVFLSKRGKVDQESKSLSYALTFTAKVPDYEIDQKFWPNSHFEGADLFRGTARIEIFPPDKDDVPQSWRVDHHWGEDADIKSETVDFTKLANSEGYELKLPFNNDKAPGIAGSLRLIVRPWG